MLTISLKFACYPCTMHCEMNTVTLLYFRRCMRLLCFDLVNMKETKLLCPSSSNLANILIMRIGWTLLILEVKCQGNGQMFKCAGMLRFELSLFTLKSDSISIYKLYREKRALGGVILTKMFIFYFLNVHYFKIYL